MREKIAGQHKELKRRIIERLVFSTNLSHYGAGLETDNILTLITEEIKKAEIPDPEPHSYGGEWEAVIAGKEVARDTILALLK